MITKNFFRCGILGWTIEILWTGLQAFRIRNLKLIGRSSLWMFPIYGSADLLTPLMQRLKTTNHTPLIKRGLIYMSLIYLGEYLSGILLKQKNLCPWDYSHTPYHYQGVIRLDYAPLWFLVGLFLEHHLLPHNPSSPNTP